jgi:hypothetical protein
MLKTSALLVVGLIATLNAYGEPKVHFTGDFETGRIQPVGTPHDGFFVKTLPNPQGNETQFVIGNGGGGPGSNIDTHVETSERVGPDLVVPRRGNYFLRSAIYFDKKYDGFIGNSGKNKPRTAMTFKSGVDEFDFDVEGYTGFSIYLPSDLEDERGKKGEQGKNMLMNIAIAGAAEFFTLNYWVPSSAEGGGEDSHWWIRLNHSTRSVDRDQTENIDMGTVNGDKGKWTDFVIRYRANPFSVDTNPANAGVANAKNQLYQGNKGIFQLWKSEGPVDSNGNRAMVLKVNKLNTPVGLVPHKTEKLGHSFRQYKHGWHQQPTTVKGPVWIGFDEIRFGLTNRDGTTYSDVHPAQLPCTDRCPGGSGSSPPPPPPPPPPPVTEDPPPNPPEELIIIQE